MNEFIVWDDKNKVFISKDNVIELNERFCGEDHFYYGDEIYPISSAEMLFPMFEDYYKDRLTFCCYIGKADINNKKIYADCSIVKFSYQYNDRSQIEVCIGYFTYSKDVLQYLFVGLDGIRRFFYKMEYGVKNLKIIDTIQENKLGLIK